MRTDDERRDTKQPRPADDGSAHEDGTHGPERRRVRSTMSASSTWWATVLAIVVFAVLGSGGMREAAEGMPLGWQRSVAMTVTGALDRVVNLVSLNRPYDWASDRLGRNQEDHDFQFPTTTTVAPGDPRSGSSAAATATASTTTTLPALRVPTAAAPLHVIVAGDSTADSLGDRLKVAVGDDPTLSIDVEAKVSTGLTRSDYFNWGARAKQLFDESRPDVMVFMVGANDTQAVMRPDGSVVAAYGTPQWSDAYRQQVAGIMDLAHDGPRRLLWIGQPVVGNSKVNATVQKVNAIIEEEASKRPWVSYFDIGTVVEPNGSFSQYVTLSDGKTVRCFAGDSVHLSMQCIDYSMTKLVPALRSLYQT